jgi:hypothetical protein
MCNGHSPTDINKFPFGCNGHVTAVAADQSRRFYSQMGCTLRLGWVYLPKTVRKPQKRGGVNFDPPMVFCSCSMQNAPAASGMLRTTFA